MSKVLSLLAILTLLSSPVWSDDSNAVANVDKPSISSSRSAVANAVVEAINHESREVTLRRGDGKTISFVVGDDARNLDQVQVGDIVTAEYIENLKIEVIAAENAEAQVGTAGVVTRAEEGEMPGVAGVETVIVTAIVEEINIEANTFKLKGPEGNIEEYTARNPENLKKAAVGDLVVISVTKAIAITVEKAK